MKDKQGPAFDVNEVNNGKPSSVSDSERGPRASSPGGGETVDLSKKGPKSFHFASKNKHAVPAPAADSAMFAKNIELPGDIEASSLASRHGTAKPKKVKSSGSLSSGLTLFAPWLIEKTSRKTNKATGKEIEESKGKTFGVSKSIDGDGDEFA